MATSKAVSIVLWVVSALLAIFFLIAGTGKLIDPGAVIEMFASWGYPAWFVTVIGLAETVGAIALMVPRARRYGAVLLILIMLGAVFTHVTNDQTNQLLRPILPMLGLAWIAWETSRGHRDA